MRTSLPEAATLLHLLGLCPNLSSPLRRPQMTKRQIRLVSDTNLPKVYLSLRACSHQARCHPTKLGLVLGARSWPRRRALARASFRVVHLRLSLPYLLAAQPLGHRPIAAFRFQPMSALSSATATLDNKVVVIGCRRVPLSGLHSSVRR